jgi:prolyl-tRNA editing enzyme YbaK/EbsC (Cys-tRNA(Pro) deacylase)
VSRVSQEPDPEQRTRAVLDRLAVPYEHIPIDPAFADTAAFCERYGYPLGHAGNTIVVASKKEPRQYAACVVLATTRLDVNRAVRDLMGVAKLSFASAEEMAALTGMRVGGVTVFGLPESVPVFVDDQVMALDWVILGTGGRDGKIKVAPEVFRRLPNARVVRGLALARPEEPPAGPA